jgi:hypothetical protein
MPINKIAYQVLEENQQNYINILRTGQPVSDTGWTTYSDLAGINPVDGLGAGAGITWTQNNINPLNSEADLRLVKDNVNRQGNGVSIPFTIDNRHLAKTLQISFDAELISATNTYENPITVPVTGTYSITSTTCTVTASHSFLQGQFVFMTFTSGTRPVDGFYTITSVTATTFVFTVASGSGTGNCNYTTRGDLRVSIIQNPDSLTPVMIEPVNTNLQLGIMNQKIRHIASFQTHISITSYRLCIHVSSGSTVAYTVDFANFKVWEPTQSIGSIITDWQSYTPTSLGVAFTSITARWRRVGGAIHVFGSGLVSSSSANPLTISLPSGLSIDTTGLVTRATSFGILYDVRVSATAVSTIGNNNWIIGYDSTYTSSVRAFVNSASALYSLDNANVGIGSGDYVNFEFFVPIAGWGSSVAMSSDTGDGRVVAVQARNLSTNGTTGALIYTTVVRDSHGAYNSTTGVFTAPVSGDYLFSLVYQTSVGSSDTPQIFFNGSSTGLALPSAENASYYRGGSYGVYLLAGQTIEFRRQAGGSSYSGTFHSISIHRISAGSQVIATAETVACSVNKTSGSVPSGTPLTRVTSWNTKDLDTHGSFDLTNGTFTVPMSVVYLINVAANNLGNFTSYNQPGFSIRSGTTGNTILANSTMYFTSSFEPELSTSALRRFTAGDIISLYGYGSGFASNALIMNISRIGT